MNVLAGFGEGVAVAHNAMQGVEHQVDPALPELLADPQQRGVHDLKALFDATSKPSLLATLSSRALISAWSLSQEVSVFLIIVSICPSSLSPFRFGGEPSYSPMASSRRRRSTLRSGT